MPRSMFRGVSLSMGAGLCVSWLGLAGGAMAQPDFHLSAEPVVRFDGHRIVRLYPQGVPDLRTYRALLTLTDDVWTHSPRVGLPLEVRLTPVQMARVVQMGIPHEVVIENVQAAIDREIAEVRTARLVGGGAGGDGVDWYATYKNNTDVRAYVESLVAAHPQLASLSVVGTSFQNRQIYGVRITGPGNAGVRPQVLFHGCQHAREWITIPVNVYIIERLLTGYGTDPVVTRLLDTVEITVVPVVNPDGYEFTWTTNRLWRKTRQTNPGSSCIGTDPNRNWGFQWGGQGASTNPCNDTFRGQSVFSSVEVAVMRNLAQGMPRLRAHIDYHSFSQLILWPWGHTTTPPPDQATFQVLGSRMESAIEGVYGTPHTIGPASTTLYLASGASVDWFYGARGVWSVLVELRDTGQFGFVLPPEQIRPTVEENWPGALAMARFVSERYCYANCDGSTTAPTLSPADFVCFLNRYRAGDPLANCDGSTGSPTLTPSDFVCYLNQYRAGCL